MSAYSNIRCVVFDLDDTLWPCEPVISHAEQVLYTWLAEHYPRITQQYSLDELRKHRENYSFRNPHIAHDVTELREQSLAELAQKFDYPRQLANDGLQLFRQHRNNVKLFDDSMPTIKYLREHFKIGAITNGNADLTAIGVREYFDFVVTPREAGAAKPDKEIFEYARMQVNFAKHELLYVGDHPIIDVLGSSQSGWKSLWFNPTEAPWLERVKPDGQIQRLSELPGLLNV
jgi:putative hydrolase of the HAD superfamily